MGNEIKTRSNLLSDLARAKALFQQRAVVAILTQEATESKRDQERAAQTEGGADVTRPA